MEDVNQWPAALRYMRVTLRVDHCTIASAVVDIHCNNAAADSAMC